MKLGLLHSYAGLPSACYVELPPTPVVAPKVLVFNERLATDLGWNAAELTAVAAEVFSGNQLADDARPLAMAYAGHQYAHFVSQLGDGRALLLGEKLALNGKRYDIQLKGSGRTPFSRAGDGRAAVGPMLREYLISEAMHAMGISTTRSLAVVATGERVFREQVLPGAVLTRVAASHLRIGTFEYFAAREDHKSMRALLDYAIQRHDPDSAAADRPALELLRRVGARQARLIAQWMSVGFIHGVMNTDNMALSGETIDFGPCAFMDHYDPRTVFSSIDHRGRYAYVNQANIAQWNLARLAETLLPMIDPQLPVAVEKATAVVHDFMPQFEAIYLQIMRRKLGLDLSLSTAPLAGAVISDADCLDLLRDLFALMQRHQADFTLSFRALSDAALGDGQRPHPEDAFRAQFGPTAAAEVSAWLTRWRSGLPSSPDQVQQQMRLANPLYIPRNHQVEKALAAASERDDLAPFQRLLAALQNPYADQPGNEALTRPPAENERITATFCGT